ncbi:MAG: Fur family transcriptional regulator [Candidatus Bipolaricaulia bacterium]
MARKERERLIARLREHGFKLTPQRQAIIELLEERGHYSAEDIYKRLQQDYPMLSRATVYNTLEVLKELGEVAELKIKPNIVLYDPETEPHYHFFCRRCGKVVDVEPLPECDPEELPARLTAGPLRGYKIEGMEVYIYGLCPRCRRPSSRMASSGEGI